MAEEKKKPVRRRRATNTVKKAPPEKIYEPVSNNQSETTQNSASVHRSESPRDSFDSLKKDMSTKPDDFGGEYLQRKKSSSVQTPSFMKGLIIIVIIGLAALSIGYMMSSGALPSFSKGKKFSAVFLDNGQVYIGRIVSKSRSELILDDVFTIQVIPQQIQGPDGTTQTIQQPQVIKKGSEFYGPESKIKINRELVAVIETLREDSSIMPDITAQLEAGI